MPSSERDEPVTTAWPRRRFLGAAAAAGAGLLAGFMAGFAGTAFPSPAAATPEAEAEPDLPIQGSPHLLSTGLPAHGAIAPWTADQARLIHFHLSGRDRDRLLLGLP